MRSGAEVRSDPEWGLAGLAALSSRDKAQPRRGSSMARIVDGDIA